MSKIVTTNDDKNSLKNHNKELNKLTIDCIIQSLILLMKQYPYEKINITQICRKAGVSRNAFYSNFKTKEDIFKRFIIEFNRHVLITLGNPFKAGTTENWYEKLFFMLQENYSTLNILIKNNFQIFYLNYINQILLNSNFLDKTEKYLRMMWNGAIQNCIVIWISTGMKEKPNQMAHICFSYVKELFKDKRKSN